MSLPNREIFTKKKLEDISKDELIDLILDLQDRYIDLENRLKKPGKNSGNSSIPPSKDENRKRGKKKIFSSREKSGRKTGGQKGHEGITRKWDKNPDSQVELYPQTCSCCGDNLGKEGEVGEKRQEIDIPPVKTTTTEYHQMKVKCENCGETNKGKFPNYTYANISFGINLHTTLSNFFHLHYGSYERTQQFAKDSYNLDISQGTINNMIERVDKKLQPCIDRIRVRLARGEYLGSDETGIWVDKKKYWQWIYQNLKDVLIDVTDNRGFKSVKESIGESFGGIWGSDRFGSQLKISSKAKQICLVHLTRDLKYLINAENSRFSYKYLIIMYKIIDMWKKWYVEKIKVPADQKIMIIKQLYKQLTKLINKALNSLGEKQKETKTFFKQMHKHRGKIITCLKFGVPHHNNDSERPLRHSKNKLKISGCFRSLKGAQMYSNFISVYHTSKRRNLDFFPTLKLLIQ